MSKARDATLVSAISLLAYTLASVRIPSPPPNPLYVAESLPVVYWVGLGLLALSYAIALKEISSKKGVGLGLIYVLAFVSYVQGLVLIFQEPLFADVPYHLENTLSQWGQLGLSSMSSYPNFIGGYFAMNAAIHLTGITPWQFARVFPIISTTVMCLSIYAFSYSFFPTFRATLGPVFFVATFWEWANHLSTMTYGLMLFSAILLASAGLLRRKKSYMPLLLLVMVSLASSPEGPIFVILLLFAFVGFSATNSTLRHSRDGLLGNYTKLAILATGTYGLWWVLASPSILAGSILSGFSSLGNLYPDIVNFLMGRGPGIVIGTTGSTLSGSTFSSQLASGTKYALAGIGIAVLLVLAYKLRGHGRISKFLYAASLSPFVFGLYGLFSIANYQPDILAVSLVGISLMVGITFGKSATRKSTTVLVAIICVGLFLMPVARYSVAADSYYTSAAITGVMTVAHFSNGYFTPANPFYNYPGEVTWILLPPAEPINASAANHTSNSVSTPAAMFDVVMYHSWITHANSGSGYVALADSVARDYNLVYANPDLVFFVSP